MNGMGKALIVAVPILLLAALIVPGWVERSAVSGAFAPELERWSKMRFTGGEGKSGSLFYPKKIEDLDQSELPTIKPGVFMMEPQRSVYIRRDKSEIREAKVFDGFHDLDAALRATDPSSVKTLVFARRESRSVVYRAVKGVAMNEVLSQIIVHVKIFDVETKKHLGTWHLYGQKTPRGYRAGETPKLAPPPSAAEFIAALPRS